jgi:hypothetical protein
MKKFAVFPLACLLLVSVLILPVLAEAPEKTDGFVCPVLGGNAGENGKSEKFVEIGGGDYTVIGPDVNVPVHATNDNGNGTPGGDHASPGEEDYSPIWG